MAMGWQETWMGAGVPELHCCSSGHGVQAARPGPWKWFLGMPRPPPQEAHGAAKLFIVLKAQPAGWPQNPSVQGGGGPLPTLLSRRCLDHLRRALPSACASLLCAGSCAVGCGPSPSVGQGRRSAAQANTD